MPFDFTVRLAERKKRRLNGLSVRSNISGEIALMLCYDHCMLGQHGCGWKILEVIRFFVLTMSDKIIVPSPNL